MAIRHSFSNLPSAFHMPVAVNAYFVGREDILHELKHRLHNDNTASQVQVLVGPGGVGKTQAAAAFSRKYRDRYNILWWINAGSAVDVEVGLADLARTLGLAQRDLSPIELRDALYKHLATRADWLIVFDEVPDARTVVDLLPQSRGGNIIVTSRNTDWSGIGQVMLLGSLDRAQSIRLLLDRTRRREDPAIADKLAKALGDLPLALDQAAALIDQTGITFDEYLHRFETQWIELLQSGRPSSAYPMSVTMSWELSFRDVERENVHASEMLALCSFLSTDRIPIKLLRDAAPFAPPAVGFVLRDATACAEAVDKLANYSLIEADDESIRVHPLAAGLARHRLDDDNRRTWASVAVRMMDETFDFNVDVPRYWREVGELLPHAMAAAAHADNVGVCPASVRSIYNAAGQYLLAVARYDEAKTLFERAMGIALTLWGPDNPRVSPIANNLGRVLLRSGDVAGALPQFEMALALDERVYGSSHPHVAEIINNRGVCLYMLGNRLTAEADFYRAMTIYQSQFDEPHVKLASIMNNLGVALVRRDIAAARERFAKALELAEASIGHDHPSVATMLRNLGDVYLKEDCPREASKCFERAMEIDVRVLSPDHPDVAADLTGLAAAYQSFGESSRARDMVNRAIAIEAARENRNVDRLIDRYELLARTCRSLDDIESARNCMVEIRRLRGETRPPQRHMGDSSPMESLTTIPLVDE